MGLRWLVPAAVVPWLLAACAGPRPVGAPFVEAEHERCAREGNGGLAGRFLLRRPDGGTEPLAGREVVLWPASDYSRALAAELAAGRHPQPEGRLAPYGRWTRTDGSGGFRFDRLPPCRYVVLAKYPGGLSGGGLLGGYAAAEAEVKDGAAVNLALDWPPAEPFRVAVRPVADPGPVRAGPPALPAPGPSPAGSKRDSVAGVPVPPAHRAPEPNRAKPERDGVTDRPPYAPDPVQRLRCAVGDRAGAGQVRATGRPRGEPAHADGLHPGPGRSRPVRGLRRARRVRGRRGSPRGRHDPGRSERCRHPRRLHEPLTRTASILSRRLHSIPARNPRRCWLAVLRLRPEMIPDRDG